MSIHHIFFFLVFFTLNITLGMDQRNSRQLGFHYFKEQVIPGLKDDYALNNYRPVYSRCDDCEERFSSEVCSIDEIDYWKEIFKYTCVECSYDPLKKLFMDLHVLLLQGETIDGIFKTLKNNMMIIAYSKFLYDKRTSLLEDSDITTGFTYVSGQRNPWDLKKFWAQDDEFVATQVSLELLSYFLLHPLTVFSFRLYTQFLEYFFLERQFHRSEKLERVFFTQENYILILIGLDHAVEENDDELVKDILHFFYYKTQWFYPIDFSIKKHFFSSESDYFTVSFPEIICSYIHNEIVFGVIDVIEDGWNIIFSLYEDKLLFLSNRARALKENWVTLLKKTGVSSDEFVVFCMKVFSSLRLFKDDVEDDILLSHVNVIFGLENSDHDKGSLFVRILAIDDEDELLSFINRFLDVIVVKGWSEIRRACKKLHDELDLHFNPPEPSFLSSSFDWLRKFSSL